MEFLILIFSLVFLAIAYLRMDIALCFIVALLPSYLIRFDILGVPSTLLEVMILIAFGVWFIKNLSDLKKIIRRKEKRENYPFYKEIIALIVISFISLVVAGFSNSALGIWKAYFFEPVLLFILIINNFQHLKDRKKLYTSLAISAFLVSIAAIYQKFTGDFIANSFWADAEHRRVVSWFSYPNAVGLFLAPIVVILSGFFLNLPKRTNLKEALFKIFILVSIFLSTLSIFFAKSEGALIALVAALFVMALFSNKRKRWFSIFLAISFFVSCLFYAPLNTYVKDKLLLNDLSGQIRVQQWKETMQTLKGKTFILGNGLNSYQEAVLPYHQEGIFFNFDRIDNFDALTWASSTLQKKYWQPVEIYLYPHNIFLNFWSELGLLGAILFMWLIFRFMFISFRLFISFARENNRERFIILGLGLAMFSILIHGLVDVPYFKNDLSAMFFVMLALLGLIWKIDSKKI